MIIGTCGDGKYCVYDLPDSIKTAEQMNALIYRHSNTQTHRKELQGQPKLLGLNGPMFNGFKILESTGEIVPVIRYELPDILAETIPGS